MRPKWMPPRSEVNAMNPADLWMYDDLLLQAQCEEEQDYLDGRANELRPIEEGRLYVVKLIKEGPVR